MTMHKLVNGEIVPLTEEEISEFYEFESEAPILAWNSVRLERNAKLAACDWTQLPDAPVNRDVWAVYRQQLRDITSQADPFEIVWPTEPE